MQIFLDTNVWLRYLIKDDIKQYHIVESLLEYNEKNEITLSTSTFILSEIVYVASSFYEAPRNNIIQYIDSIIEIHNISIIEDTNIHKTLTLFKENKHAKWSDCIIAAQVPRKYKLCSFDQKLKNLMEDDRFILPEEVMKN